MLFNFFLFVFITLSSHFFSSVFVTGRFSALCLLHKDNSVICDYYLLSFAPDGCGFGCWGVEDCQSRDESEIDGGERLIIFIYFSPFIPNPPLSNIYLISPDQLKMNHLNQSFLRSDERADEAGVHPLRWSHEVSQRASPACWGDGESGGDGEETGTL